ncbi:MAG TPA: alpha/beta fold hydrolase [Caulobacteraceae bacterium]|jgi:pimeloyl-ACP methyl ester carboxylesterase|nr:alpha/beta fold hydrolase [Caulobacteraceae bacterium]
MAFVQSDGARIHWEADGQGSPVLLIMGHLYTSAMWWPLLPALVRRHRAIWFDNRGVGRSDTTRTTTIAQMTADALAVLDAAGAQRAHVFGVSLGGGIAAEFAMRYPDRVASLVLGCTMMKTPDKPAPRRGVRLIYRLPLWLVRPLLRATRSAKGYGSAAPADLVAKDFEVQDDERFTMAGVAAQAAAITAYSTTREAVAAIAAPTLVLHGDEDATVDVKYGREFAQAIPGAKLILLEGAGHNFPLAAQAKTTQAVLDFFAAVDAGAPSGQPVGAPAVDLS